MSNAVTLQPCEDCISREATVKRLCQIAELMNKKRDGLGSPYVMAALFIQDNKDEFPSVTPQPCDDAISRQAVLDVIRKSHCEEWVKAEIGAPIEALQSVTAHLKTGGDHD